MEKKGLFQRRFFSFGVFFALFVAFFASALAGAFVVSAPDTISGYPTDLVVRNANPNETVVFFVKDPSGSVVKFSTKASSKGTASAQFPAERTKNAGIYEVSAVRQGQTQNDGSVYDFEVFADDTSASVSKILTNSLSLPIKTNGKMTVILRDRNGNPVENHRVSLVSSRSSDSVSPLSTNKTNEKGEVIFSVQSASAGQSSFSAIDETLGTTLSSRVNVLFYKNGGTGSSFSANLLGGTAYADREDISGSVVKFELDFPKTVKVDSDENYLTVRALDAEGRVASNFTGEILIQVPNDPNVILPAQDGKYTFTKQDQGEITFSLSLVFSETGSKKVEVFLLDGEEIDENIFGEMEVNVIEKTDGGDATGKADIKILSPSANAAFSSRSVSVSGIAKRNSDIKIFVDNAEAKTVAVDDSGNFQTRLDGLSDGTHKIYAMQVDGKRETSDEISFSVDGKSAKIQKATFFPSEVLPEEEVRLEVLTEKNLDTVQAFWAVESEFMEEKEDGKFVLIFKAPKESGEYEVAVELLDGVGNKSKETLSEKLVVKTASNNVPTNLKGEYQKESGKFLLSWDAPKAETVPVLYLIHAGETPETLQKIGSTAGAKTSAEIANLETGKKWYFAVSAVNETGSEGEKSEKIALESEIFHAAPPPKVIEISATGKENGILISWISAPNAASYEILYGTESKKYEGTKTALATDTSFFLQDLIPDMSYFITIKAKDSAGNIIKSYDEVMAIPLKPSFFAAATTIIKAYPKYVAETGPRLFMFLGAIFFMAGGTVMMRRERE